MGAVKPQDGSLGRDKETSALTRVGAPPHSRESRSSARDMRFCPNWGMFTGGTRQFSHQTQSLLRTRLTVTSGLALFVIIVFLLRGLLAWGPLHLEMLFPLTVLAVCFGLLASQIDFSLARLRIFEFAVFGSVTAHLVFVNYLLTQQSVLVGNPAAPTLGVYRAAVGYFALIVVYGMFIPNTWKRGLAAVIPMAAVGAGLTLYLWRWQLELGSPVAGMGTVEDVSYVLSVLVVAVTISVVGSQIIHSTRQDATKARVLGTYQLEEKLGEGGMGEVWKARHHLLARPAAVKMIRAEILEARNGGEAETVIARFQQEAQSTASLRSPHTVELYDFGRTRTGLFFYIMEYLEGLDLDSLIEKFGPVEPGRAIYLLRQAAESLAEAHRLGLVHRDIKPSNIFVCRMGLSFDFVKVLDFGLAKSLRSFDGDDAKLTQEGMTTGTPAYMAPELVLGNRSIDARADIYALGCVAYWLLTGQLVFESKSSMELVVEHVKTPPVPPSHTHHGIAR